MHGGHMRRWIERHDQALRHVTDGLRIVDRQYAVIARKKGLGHDTTLSEALLAEFEQAIFEIDLARSVASSMGARARRKDCSSGKLR
jgi:hypothetical protein